MSEKKFNMADDEIIFDSAFDEFLIELDVPSKQDNCGNEGKNVYNSSGIQKENNTNEIEHYQENSVHCLSPILGPLASKTRMITSSTPLSKIINMTFTNQSQEKLKIHSKPPSAKKSIDNKDFDFVDLDLFEDWDYHSKLDDKIQESKSFITISQAVDMIAKTKTNSQTLGIKELSNINEESNISVDLITGQVITSKQNNDNKLFFDSFDFSKAEFNDLYNDNINYCGNKNECKKIILYPSKNLGIKDQMKPTVAQKLNFENLTTESLKNNFEFENKNLDSDNSFNEFLQTSFIDKLNFDELTKAKASGINSKLLDSDVSIKYVKNNSGWCKKRKKVFKILEESDSEEDNSCLKKVKKKTTGKTLSENCSIRDFLDLEAEESGENNSDDEDNNEEDEFEKSFIDDNLYFSQNKSLEMTAKYLESVKITNNRPGTFKIPKHVPYIMDDVFSQYTSDHNSDYEMDSFCVNDIEYEEKELSDLEIAEKLLETKRKFKKRSSKHCKK